MRIFASLSKARCYKSTVLYGLSSTVMQKSRMARDDLQVNFRIPASLKERLEHAASENKRSITAELVHRLEASFPQAPRDPDMKPDVQRVLDEFQLSIQHTVAAQRALEEMLAGRRDGLSEGEFKKLTGAAAKALSKK